MNKCLNCGKEIIQKNGGKERKFCDNNNACKQSYFNKQKKEPRFVRKDKFDAVEKLNKHLLSKIEEQEKKFEAELAKILEPKKHEQIKVVKDIVEFGVGITEKNGNHIPFESELGQKIINQASEKPEKMKGESGMDYAIRLAEWKEKQK